MSEWLLPPGAAPFRDPAIAFANERLASRELRRYGMVTIGARDRLQLDGVLSGIDQAALCHLLTRDTSRRVRGRDTGGDQPTRPFEVRLYGPLCAGFGAHPTAVRTH